jgi:hypothetical protein
VNNLEDFTFTWDLTSILVYKNEAGCPHDKPTQRFYLSPGQQSNRMSEPLQNSDSIDLSQPTKEHTSSQPTMSPKKPPRLPPYITEQEFISDHIFHSNLKSKSLALEEAQDILKLLIGMKMFKDLGGRIYQPCDMEDLCKISQRVECLRTALTDFDDFMARKYQGVKQKVEWEGRDRFEDLVGLMDEVEAEDKSKSEELGVVDVSKGVE